MGERAGWLLSRSFLCGLVVLVLNDHVLKARFDSLLTGKLSDVAGLVVVGTLLSVLLGCRYGLIVTAICFALLKTIPAAGVLVAPVLGGPTVADPTDLVALLFLVPLASALRRQEARWLRDGRGASPGSFRSVLLPLAVAIAALSGSTATSCAPGSSVVHVTTSSGVFFALISDSGSAVWAKSTDGGYTWAESAPPPGPQPRVPRPYEDPGPSGPLHACATKALCWTLRDRTVVQRSDGVGEPVVEVRLSSDDVRKASTSCTGGNVGILDSVAVTGGETNTKVVVSLGSEGVLVRGSDGQWRGVGVLGTSPAPTRIDMLGWWVALLAAPTLGAILVIWRRRWPSWKEGVLIAAVGWLTTLMLVGAVSFFAGPDLAPAFVTRALMAGTVVTLATAFVRARRSHEPTRALRPPPTATSGRLPPPP